MTLLVLHTWVTCRRRQPRGVLSVKQSGLTTKNRSPASLSWEGAGAVTFTVGDPQAPELAEATGPAQLGRQRLRRCAIGGARPFVRLALLGALLVHATGQIGTDAMGAPSFPLATHGSVPRSSSWPVLTRSCPLSPWSSGSLPE